jgi:hypothetical protein
MVKAPSPEPIPALIRVEMQRRMLRIRFFEEVAQRLKDEGVVAGPVHCATGQEATVVGACLAQRESDTLTGTHRSHGHPIAKAAALEPLMAELLGRRDGICRGQAAPCIWPILGSAASAKWGSSVRAPLRGLPNLSHAGRILAALGDEVQSRATPSLTRKENPMQRLREARQQAA